MNESIIASDFLVAANAVVGFSVLQNIAFSYELLKRNLPLRIQGIWQWMMVCVGFFWNSTYVYSIWWCSTQAITLSGLDPASSLYQSAVTLSYAECIASGFFGIWPVWILIIYNHKPFWPESNRTIS